MWYLVLISTAAVLLQGWMMWDILTAPPKRYQHKASPKFQKKLVMDTVKLLYDEYSVAARTNYMLCGESVLIILAHLAMAAKGKKLDQLLQYLDGKSKAEVLKDFPKEINHFYKATPSKTSIITMETLYLCYELCEHNKKFTELAKKHFYTDIDRINQYCYLQNYTRRNKLQMVACNPSVPLGHYFTLSSYALHNTIYTMCYWKTPFSLNKVTLARFNGHKKEDDQDLEFLSITGTFKFGEPNFETKVVEIPCETPDLTFMIMLSDRYPGVVLHTFLHDNDFFTAIIRSLKNEIINVTIPIMYVHAHRDFSRVFRKTNEKNPLNTLFENGSYTEKYPQNLPKLAEISGVFGLKNVTEEEHDDFIVSKFWQLSSLRLNADGFEASANTDISGDDSYNITHLERRTRSVRDKRVRLRQGQEPKTNITFTATKPFIFLILHFRLPIFIGHFSGYSIPRSTGK